MLQSRCLRLVTSTRVGLCQRLYSTEPPKASVKLVSQLRKATNASIAKAREALLATDNDFKAAMEWLEEDLKLAGKEKAAKLAGREAKQGLIGLSVMAQGLGTPTGKLRASIIELNCETDFVAQNQLFEKLVTDIAFSAAFHAEQPTDFQDTPTLLRPFSVDNLLDAPFLETPQESSPPPQSLYDVKPIGSEIRDAITKLGEKISLRRAATVVLGAPDQRDKSVSAGVRLGSYAHGGKSSDTGRIGALVLLFLKSPQLWSLAHSPSTFTDNLEKLNRALARQIVGMDTRSIHYKNESPETSLYEQQFSMFPGEYSSMRVREALQKWASQHGMQTENTSGGFEGVSVSEFARWTVGEDLDAERPQIVSAIAEQQSSPV